MLAVDLSASMEEQDFMINKKPVGSTNRNQMGSQ